MRMAVIFASGERNDIRANKQCSFAAKRPASFGVRYERGNAPEMAEIEILKS
jgi:hypothetical protein